MLKNVSVSLVVFLLLSFNIALAGNQGGESIPQNAVNSNNKALWIENSSVETNSLLFPLGVSENFQWGTGFHPIVFSSENTGFQWYLFPDFLNQLDKTGVPLYESFSVALVDRVKKISQKDFSSVIIPDNLSEGESLEFGNIEGNDTFLANYYLTKMFDEYKTQDDDGSDDIWTTIIPVYKEDEGEVHPPERTMEIADFVTVSIKRVDVYENDNTSFEVSLSQALSKAVVIVLSNTSPDYTITGGSIEKVYGKSSPNQITLESGAHVELINFPGQNTIQLQSGSDLFTVFRSGMVVSFQGSDGTMLKIPATRDVQTISFNGEQSRVLQIHNNQVMLDDQKITIIPTSIEDGHREPATCGAYIAPDVWKEFDCYNLAAFSKTYGDDPFTPSWRLIGGYWQWGRKGPNPSQWSGTNTPHFAHGPTGPGTDEANDDNISEWDNSYAPDGAWSDSHKTVNDPCPAGFRVPTISQWKGVRNNNTHSIVGTWSYSVTNYSSAQFFGNDLMLPAAGIRSSSGVLGFRGYLGSYWSSSELSSYDAWSLDFICGSTGWGSGSRRYGYSVRCVAE